MILRDNFYRPVVNGKPHTWSKKSAALAGGDC